MKDSTGWRSTVLRTLAIVWASALIGAVSLGALLALHNPGWGPGSLLELFVAMHWICLWLNAGFVVLLVPIGLATRRWLPERLSAGWPTLLVSGLVGLHLAWALFHRLQMPQLWLAQPRLITRSGIAQTVLLVLLVACVIGAGLGWRRWRGRSVVAAGAALAIGLLCLAWNARDQRVERRYPLDRIAAAAEAVDPPTPDRAAPETGRGRVIVLAVDGLSWNVAVPLMEAGRLPRLARLVREGAFGYLDNGDDSFSPRIWNTVFSGRPAEVHGVHGFLKVILPRSGKTLFDLVSQKPAVDTFFAVKQFFHRVPSAGLWRWIGTTSGDVRVKRVWEIASEHERPVVVANVNNLVPVRPVRGAMILFANQITRHLAYPESLVDRWSPFPGTGEQRSLDEWREVLQAEIELTTALIQEHDADLAIYYTTALDDVTHLHWNFFAPDAFLLRDLPGSLPDADWKALVRRSVEQPAIAVYERIDRSIGRFVEAFPRATFVVCSDHGWTFSGYGHFNSPDGAIVVSGPGVTPSARLDTARIEDVAPTLLAMLGLPVSREIEGRVLREAFLEPPKPIWVDAFDPPGELPQGAEPFEVDPGLLERLDALGYVR